MLPENTTEAERPKPINLEAGRRAFLEPCPAALRRVSGLQR
jgi:hypothetical protein